MPLRAFQRQLDPTAADAWFASPAGLALLGSETDCVNEALRQRPGQMGLWLGPALAIQGDADADNLLQLQPALNGQLQGDLRCALPLPLASDSCACVVVQHAADCFADPLALLQECSRVLLPGGWLWLLALNPVSPYRLRWRGQGLSAYEPVTSRRRLRAAGLTPDPLSQGLGPTWDMQASPELQNGAGVRAAFLLRAQKRRLPMTPLRRRSSIRWQPGAAA